MPKSIFTEGRNFTEGCGTCPFWADGTDNRGYGCAIPAPIMACPYFSKMYEEEEKKAKNSQNGKE